MDWNKKAAVQDVLAGRFTAWNVLLRGLEDVAIDLFHHSEVFRSVSENQVPFQMRWSELHEEEWTWPCGSSKAKKRETLWSAIK